MHGVKSGITPKPAITPIYPLTMYLNERSGTVANTLKTEPQLLHLCTDFQEFLSALQHSALQVFHEHVSPLGDFFHRLELYEDVVSSELVVGIAALAECAVALWLQKFVPLPTK